MAARAVGCRLREVQTLTRGWARLIRCAEACTGRTPPPILALATANARAGYAGAPTARPRGIGHGGPARIWRRSWREEKRRTGRRERAGAPSRTSPRKE